jgi:hypothetical protein
VSGRIASPKPRGIRRVERWLVGVAFAVIAFVLERVVVRAVRREGGPARTVAPEARTFTSRGGDVDVE